MPSAIRTAIDEQREGMIARETVIQARMAAAYDQALAGLEYDLIEITNIIDRARAAGVTVHPDWLRRQDRYRRLIAEADLQFQRFTLGGDAVITDGVTASAAAGVGDASDLVGHATPSRVAGTFDGHVNTPALERLVSSYSDTSPLRPILDAYGTHATDAIERGLIQGIASGQNAREITRSIMREVSSADVRANLATLVRTEMARSYRGAMVDQYQAFSDVLAGYVWTCDRSSRTCLACLAMDGEVFPLDNPPDQFHPNCRCSIAPEPADLWPSVAAALGSGKQWFDRQPDSVKRRMLPSKAAFNAYKAGTLTLDDFVGVRDSPEWGATIYQRSGKTAVAASAR